MQVISTPRITPRVVKDVRSVDDRMTVMFDALRDPCRFRIAILLLRASEACVSEIASAIDASLPGASRHLKIMESAGLLNKRRDGQSVCYRLKTEHVPVKDLMTLLSRHTSR